VHSAEGEIALVGSGRSCRYLRRVVLRKCGEWGRGLLQKEKKHGRRNFPREKGFGASWWKCLSTGHESKPGDVVFETKFELGSGKLRIGGFMERRGDGTTKKNAFRRCGRKKGKAPILLFEVKEEKAVAKNGGA